MGLRRLLTIAVAALAVVLFSGRDCPATAGKCYEAQVEDISGRKYFPAVKDALSKAKKSISLVMYLIELSSHKENLKADQLVSSLIEAKQRGVDVEVILDQNVDFVQRRSKSEWEAKVKSMRAYKRLKEAGVKARYDEPVRYTHAKAIIIDERIVILGSTNWTESSLNKSNEINVLIKSKSLADEVLSYIKAIKIDENIEKYLESSGPVTPISREFIENPALAPQMVKARDERAFDIYLYLLKVFSRNPEAKLTLSYESLARYLGIYEGWNSVDYRRQITKSLKKLEQRYKLIKFETGYGKEATVTLTGYEIASSPTAPRNDGREMTPRNDGSEMVPYNDEEEDDFGLPDDYFNFGWNRILSLRAKFCYLINLSNSDISDTKPFWSKSVARISEQSGGVSQDVIKTGMGELRRKRLIEVKYDSLTDKAYDQRLPKMYKVLKLYDPKELESKLGGLELKYGKEAYSRARKYAEIVFEENNPEAVEDIILKANQYGWKRIKKAFAIVSRKNIDNPKRVYSYVVGTIERMQAGQNK